MIKFPILCSFYQIKKFQQTIWLLFIFFNLSTKKLIFRLHLKNNLHLIINKKI
jgi:hypothetical protein